MDQSVVLIYLEDERVVDVVTTENLHSEAGREQYEADYRSEVVCVYAREYLVPIWVVDRRTNAEEQEEAEKYGAATTEEGDQVGVFSTDLVVLGVKLCLGLVAIALAKAISVESEQIVGQNLELFGHLAFFHLEGHIIDD